MDLLSSWESWYRMTILKHIFEQESAYSHILLHKGLQQLGLGQVKVESWTWNLSLFHEWQKQAEVSHHCCFCIRRKLVIGAGAGTLTLRCRFPNKYLSHKVLCLSEVWNFFIITHNKKKCFIPFWVWQQPWFPEAFSALISELEPAISLPETLTSTQHADCRTSRSRLAIWKNTSLVQRVADKDKDGLSRHPNPTLQTLQENEWKSLFISGRCFLFCAVRHLTGLSSRCPPPCFQLHSWCLLQREVSGSDWHLP